MSLSTRRSMFFDDEIFKLWEQKKNEVEEDEEESESSSEEDDDDEEVGEMSDLKKEVLGDDSALQSMLSSLDELEREITKPPQNEIEKQEALIQEVLDLLLSQMNLGPNEEVIVPTMYPGYRRKGVNKISRQLRSIQSRTSLASARRRRTTETQTNNNLLKDDSAEQPPPDKSVQSRPENGNKPGPPRYPPPRSDVVAPPLQLKRKVTLRSLSALFEDPLFDEKPSSTNPNEEPVQQTSPRIPLKGITRNVATISGPKARELNRNMTSSTGTWTRRNPKEEKRALDNSDEFFRDLKSPKPTGTIGRRGPVPKETLDLLNEQFNVSEILHEGWITVQGEKRWARLLYHRLECWKNPADIATSPSIGKISLGFKYIMYTAGSDKFDIGDVLSLRTKKISVATLDKSDTQVWVTNIQKVINRHCATFPKQIGLMNNWIATKLRVFIGTWNVGNACPPDDLSSWLPNNDEHDIIAIGAQECKYTPKSSGTCGEEWLNRLIKALTSSYVLLAYESLWEIRNAVFIKQSLAGFATSIASQTVATGIANKLGNKGGVGIRFQLFDSMFCFVNAHLAAHMENCESRNFDFHQIVTQLKIGRRDVDFSNYHHYNFFYGDLNYRLEEDREKIMKWIGENNVQSLQGCDQLIREQSEQRVLIDFKETPPTFKPTYRFERGSYDSKGERVYNDEKLRVPSWCDRILWKAYPGHFIERKTYQCCDHISTSDHSPVSATFNLGARLPSTIVDVLHDTLGKINNVMIPAFSYPLAWTNSNGWVFFSDVSATLSVNREPNVYIKFLAWFFVGDKKYKTIIQKKTNTPNWVEVQPIPIINQTSLEYIQSQHIVLVFMDDVQGRNNIPLGQAVVSLADACSGTPISFTSTIMYHGKNGGTVSGTVQVVGLTSVADQIDNICKSYKITN